MDTIEIVARHRCASMGLDPDEKPEGRPSAWTDFVPAAIDEIIESALDFDATADRLAERKAQREAAVDQVLVALGDVEHPRSVHAEITELRRSEGAIIAGACILGAIIMLLIAVFGWPT